jgi:hypothetical protein
MKGCKTTLMGLTVVNNNETEVGDETEGYSAI